jgi:hypothetical protein
MALLADIGLSMMLTILGFSLLGFLGDLLLIETGLFAISGGFLEFSQSKGAYEIRRVIFQTKDRFSTAKHKEASRSATVLFSTALALFLFLILLVLFE